MHSAAQVLGLLSLGLMYALIISEVVPKMLAAMVASCVILGLQNHINESTGLSEVVSWIDYETVCLLFGMMVMVGIFSETGAFEWLAVRAYRLSRGDTWRLLVTLSVLCAVLSAALDNVTIILLVVPVTMKLCDVLGLPPTPIVLSEVIFSNIGGALTPIGDPPNVIIVNNRDVQAAGVTFLSFTAHTFVGVALAFAVTVIYLYFFVRPALATSIPAAERLTSEMQLTRHFIETVDPHLYICKASALQRLAVLESQIHQQRCHARDATSLRPSPDELLARYPITNVPLFVKTGTILGSVVVLFFLHSAVKLRLSVALISIVGAVSMMLVTKQPLAKVLHNVEWETLLFFAALFVVTRGLEELGLITEIADWTAGVIKAAPPTARPTVAVLLVLFVSSLASAFIDNIPFTAAMVPVIVKLSTDSEVQVPLQPLIYALSFGTCFGGNGTIIGATANVVATGLAQQHGYRISFATFLSLGLPIMVLTTLAAALYMVVLVQLY